MRISDPVEFVWLYFGDIFWSVRQISEPYSMRGPCDNLQTNLESWVSGVTMSPYTHQSNLSIFQKGHDMGGVPLKIDSLNYLIWE